MVLTFVENFCRIVEYTYINGDVNSSIVSENASTSATMTLTPIPLISPPTTNQEANLSATSSRTPESDAGGKYITFVITILNYYFYNLYVQ